MLAPINSPIWPPMSPRRENNTQVAFTPGVNAPRGTRATTVQLPGCCCPRKVEKCITPETPTALTA